MQDSNSTGFAGRCQGAGGSIPGARLAQAIEDMQQGQDRVGEEHAGSGIAHNRPNAIALSGSVTMDRAFSAGGFTLLERAMVETLAGIGEQFAALLTGNGGGMVMIAAVTVDHCLNGAGLAL